MKVFRVLFLMLIVMSSIAFAQTEEEIEMPSAPQAVKVVEFGKVTNGYIKMQLDNFFVELANNPTAQGYIIDFDKAVLFVGGLPEPLAKKNLQRLLRSALKLDPQRQYLTAAEWDKLVTWYHETR